MKLSLRSDKKKGKYMHLNIIITRIAKMVVIIMRKESCNGSNDNNNNEE
jgi:hypothetical protein